MKSVDPIVLQQIEPRVERFFGPRKHLVYVIEIWPNEAYSTCSKLHQDQPLACVTKTFEDFELLRKSLVSRVGGGHNAFRKMMHKCHCHPTRNSCPFQVAKSFIERLRFSSLPLLMAPSESHIRRRQQEMNQFLASVLALINKFPLDHNATSSSAASWALQCGFLQDVLNFLEIEPRFEQRMQQALFAQQRQLNLNGWKAFNMETFGVGLPVTTSG